MELFRPNNLSVAKPVYTPVLDSALNSEVAAILHKQYGLPVSQHISLSQPVGANVASQNLVVDAGGSRLFIKRRNSKHATSLLKEAKVAAELSSLQLKVPRPVVNREGQLICVDEDFCLAVYRFEEGEYFSGQGRQLDSAAEAFAALTRAATDIGSDEHDLVPGNNQQFLSELTTLLDETRALNHPTVTPAIEQHYEQILNHLSTVSAHNQTIQSARLVLHPDYHPLNLLMKNDEVICILDFEHVKSYPVLAGLGFAGYKLSRQAMVNPDVRNQEIKNPTLLTRWLNGWRTKFADLEFSPQQLGIGALYQELFLIHLILNAFLRKSDSRFLYDLEKHLIGLYEIEALVSRY